MNINVSLFRTASLLLAGLLTVSGLAAQQKGPLKNSSIITMSSGGTSESVLLYMIKSNETEFDLSPKGIADLRAAKVSQKVIDAMTTSAQKTPGSAPSGGMARAVTPAPARQPYVELVSGKSRVAVPRFLARITTAKVERKDLTDLAIEGAVGQSLENTAEDAAANLVSRRGSSLASSATEAAKGLVGGLFKKKPKLTYLWSIPVQMTLLNVAVDKPAFQVYYQSVPHGNGEDFTPYIVRLVRERKNDWRLVGASEGSPEALTDDAWEVFDDFSQEEVKVSVNRGDQGQMTVEARKVLEPGEYAVVLRPASSSKKFSGPDISESANEGLLFNSVWGFTVKGQK